MREFNHRFSQDRVGMQRAQAAEAQPWNAHVERREGKLGGDVDAQRHAHHAPDDGHDGKLADDAVVPRDGG